MKKVNLLDLGTLDYGKALDIQLNLLAKVKAKEICSTLILVEHPDVITLGKRGNDQSLFLPRETLKERGISVYEIDRGGDATAHGYKQIVGYPIFSLDYMGMGIREFVEGLEDVLISHLKSHYGLDAYRGSGEKTGVWTKDKKITAFGFGVKGRVTYHGFAYNVGTDLSLFDLINPCGLGAGTVTTLERLLGREIDFDLEKSLITDSISKGLQVSFDRVRLEDLNE